MTLRAVAQSYTFRQCSFILYMNTTLRTVLSASVMPASQVQEVGS